MPKKEPPKESPSTAKTPQKKTSSTPAKKTTAKEPTVKTAVPAKTAPAKTPAKSTAKTTTKSTKKPQNGGTLKKVDAVAEVAVDKRGKMQQQDRQTYSSTNEQDASSIRIGKIRVGFVTIEDVEIGKAKQKTKNYKP